MRSLLLSLALIATPATAADQFDLVCKGTIKESYQGRERPIEVRYRVDLAAGTYCWWQCKTIATIKAVEPGRLVFQLVGPTLPRQTRITETVDRTTGAWIDERDNGDPWEGYSSSKGTCEPAPFSGFPATKF